MKKFVFSAILLSLWFNLSGCFVSVKEESRCHHKKNAVCEKNDTTIAEINAVRMLGSESSRLRVLKEIAKRPGLSKEARLHLIDSVRLLASESSREEVLLSLSQNPPAFPMTEEYVVEEPGRQSTSVTKAEIDAVIHLGTNDSRKAAYLSLASCPHLSNQARIQLARAIVNLGTNDAREKVLLALAKNDCVSSGAGVTIEEIDAVIHLGTNNSRRNVYVAQARHPYLSPEARRQLAGAIVNLGTNDARQQVLMALGETREVSP